MHEISLHTTDKLDEVTRFHNVLTAIHPIHAGNVATKPIKRTSSFHIYIVHAQYYNTKEAKRGVN